MVVDEWKPGYMKLMKLLLERKDSKYIDFHTSIRSMRNVGNVAPVIHLLERYSRFDDDDDYDTDDEQELKKLYTDNLDKHWSMLFFENR
jgi:hypothetical protein